MIKVQSLIDQWEERLIDCQENTTERLIRDTISVLEFLEAPLTEQDRKDLDLMHRVRSGQVKKSVCKEYAIYNGDWYRDNPWNIPKEQEPRVMTLTEAFDAEVAWLERYADPEDGVEPIIQPVIIRYYENGYWECLIELDESPELTLFIEDFNSEFRFWTARPTDEQRKAVKWDG